jgi:ankyrin repeat protein
LALSIIVGIGFSATRASAQRLAIFSCAMMSRHIVAQADRDGAVARLIATRKWDRLRSMLASGYRLPRNIRGRGERAQAERAFRSVALVFASARGDLPRVERLLTEGADANVAIRLDSYATPLAWAARCNHPRVADRLLRAGARLNRRLGYSDNAFVHIGGSALIWASDAGAVETVRLLLSRGARTDYRETVCWQGRPRGRRGATALDVAANAAVRSLLLRRSR